MVKLLIVDDDPLVRAGLRLMIGSDPSLTIVGEGSDGDEVEPLVDEHEPDVVLLDIRMPRVDGLAATKKLMQRENPPNVLILTTFDADEYVLKALASGASGFLLKDTPPEGILAAIRQVAAGEHTLSPGVMAAVIEAATSNPALKRRDEARADLACLTERERVVAVAVADGKSNAEIANELYLSVSAVKAHLARVFAKLGLRSRVQIAILVRDAE